LWAKLALFGNFQIRARLFWPIRGSGAAPTLGLPALQHLIGAIERAVPSGLAARQPGHVVGAGNETTVVDQRGFDTAQLPQLPGADRDLSNDLLFDRVGGCRVLR
jgi:hypothetical protein